MKLKSILLKALSILFTLAIIGCGDSTSEENEEILETINSSIPKKVVKFLAHYEECFTLITEEEIIIDEEEELDDYSTIDLSDTPFPITIILNGETTEVSIVDAEELLSLVENCTVDTNDDSVLSSSEINAEILSDLTDCFSVVIEESAKGKNNSKNNSSNYSIDFSDLIFPLTILISGENEEIIIEDKESLIKIIKNCDSHDKDCNDHDEEEECSFAITLIDDFDGEGTLITVESENLDDIISYEWSTGETSSFIYVFPNETTTYTVIATDQDGCTDTESITI